MLTHSFTPPLSSTVLQLECEGIKKTKKQTLNVAEKDARKKKRKKARNVRDLEVTRDTRASSRRFTQS